MFVELHLLLALVCVSIGQGHASSSVSASAGETTPYERDLEKFNILRDEDGHGLTVQLYDSSICNNIKGAKVTATAQTGSIQVWFEFNGEKKSLRVLYTGAREDVQLTGQVYCAHP